ncbi:MAG: gamma-glutamyltransferase [Gammaproteobacteria bacterium]|nr:gamma-glutamyltransferase [Gammaproteobacteria bacterium]
MTTTISSRPSTTRRHAALGAVLALLFTQLFAAAAQTAAAQTAAAQTAAAQTAVQRAAVAAPDRYGAEVAESVMRSGGNAVDAAVATAFVLAVTFPEAGNLGGGGFITLKMGTATAFLDFREVAPQAASRDMYLDAAGKPIPGASLIGHRAAGVPGTVAGLWEAHRKYGSRPWPELLQPAIRLARDGFVPPQPLIDSVAESLADYAGKTNFAEYFGKVGNRRFKQPELARALQRIAERGSAGFYSGRTADLIVAEMRRGNGLITHADLAAYRAIWREPLSVRWRNYTLVSAPPPSSGGIALVQLLRMKDALAKDFAGVPHNSATYVHLIAEISKRVFADRAEYLGDPDFVRVPVAALTDEGYLQRRAAEVRRDAISPLGVVKPGLAESAETTHFSILDGEGNAVALTYTLNGGFGSGVVVKGAGFLLNNEMDDFSTKPGVPNLFGVVGGVANEIHPGKRMLSSMTPTLLLENDRVRMVLGTPGGSTIFTSVFQTMVNRLDFGMSAVGAVAAARFHHQLLPPTLIVHSRCCALGDERTRADLKTLGYDVKQSPWEFGDMQLIDVDAKGVVTAAADPRGRGVARVFDTR